MRRLVPVLAAALAAAGPPAPGQEAAAEPPLGSGAAFGVLEAVPTATVPAGTPLRSRPDTTGEVLVRIVRAVELPILELRGDWVRTHYGDWTGWLAPDGEERAVAVPTTALTTSPMVLDTAVVERAARVADARSLLAAENPAATSLGPWPLHTDVTNPELLARLGRIAELLPSLYATRFGLEPSLEEAPAVVLFARQADYRRFTESHTEVGGLHGGGHADDAMAALYAEGSVDEISGILVHELTHLLNRRRFVEPPRTWVEEGLANDLGLSRLRADGSLLLGSLTGEVRTVTHRASLRRMTLDTRISGGRATWVLLLREWEERRAGLHRLSDLLDMGWTEFIAADQRSWHYAQSTFFVRYLLDHGPAEWRAAFRDFLRAAAAGGASDAAALAAALDTPPAEIQRRFERWLTTSLVHSD